MKAIYMIYAILFKGVSVIRIIDDMGDIFWAAHDEPQDGEGGHSGNWAEALTPQEAVSLLSKMRK